MVDLELLARRARRANELGRLRAASRVVLPVSLAGAAAVVAGADIALCACFGVMLVLLAVGLRWWSRTGASLARGGLWMGLIPLAAGIATMLLGAYCEISGPLSICTVLCPLAGLVAGIGTIWIAAKRNGWRGFADGVAATTVAGLMAAIGCAPLGAGSLVAVLAALTAGAVVSTPLRRLRLT